MGSIAAGPAGPSRSIADIRIDGHNNRMRKSGTKLAYFPVSAIIRRSLLRYLLATVLLFIGIVPWDFDKWRRILLERDLALFAFILVAGAVVVAYWQWSERRERQRWSVGVIGELISVTDEKGVLMRTWVSDLDMVAALSSDSPWRDDLDIGLYDRDGSVVTFPLIASGGEDFLSWFSGLEGFQSDELATVRASTRACSRIIWESDDEDDQGDEDDESRAATF